jgi:hypothetical protein
VRRCAGPQRPDAILDFRSKCPFLCLFGPAMPDKPLWYDRLELALEQLEGLPSPWVDRSTLEAILGVGRRRAQQILQPLARRTLGKNVLADKEEVIAYLRQLAAGDAASFERRRRERLHTLIATWHKQAKEQPQVLVEAPVTIVNQELDSLPRGVRLAPGRIVIEDFTTPEQAKQKLLALVMAMGNDPEGFDGRITVETHPE